MRRWRMPFLAYADTLIPSLAFGHFLGRLGCFAAGCCWGGVAHGHLPWAVRFPPESLAFQTFAGRDDPATFLAPDRLSTLPLHPVQLYESFGELGLFLVLVLVVRPRKAFHGQVLATWLLAYAVLRTTVELFRADVERGVIRGLGVGQWTSLAIFALGAAIWAKARARAAPLRASPPRDVASGAGPAARLAPWPLPRLAPRSGPAPRRRRRPRPRTRSRSRGARRTSSSRRRRRSRRSSRS